MTDVSQESKDAGTEVPIVFESDTRSRIHLIGIPADPNSRFLLRIYDWDAQPIFVNVKMDAIGTGQSLTTQIQLANVCTSAPCDTPTYAALDLGGFISTIFKTASPAAVTGIRVEVTPVTGLTFAGDDVRLWAFATITNNVTQHVTLVTPHHEDKHVRGPLD